MGVCGKDNETALLQDLLVHAAKGIAMVMHRAGVLGVRDREIDRFIVEMLFTTVTNVNFDPIRIEALLGKAGTLLERAIIRPLPEKPVNRSNRPAERSSEGTGQSQ